MTFADIGDRLKFEEAESLSLTITGPSGSKLDAGDDNLVLRAARQLARVSDHPAAGAKITLEKNLPVASGVGGGSADAAATLKGLNELWACGLDLPKLQETGLELGADVPMCLMSEPCRVEGIGEIISPVSMPSFPVVLVNPGIPLSTPQIFAALKDRDNGSLPAMPQQTTSADWLSWLAKQRNDLQNPAIETEPSIATCLEALDARPTCCLARMSGSGATCFGIFETAAQAKAAADAISATHPNWWVVATRTISNQI